MQEAGTIYEASEDGQCIARVYCDLDQQMFRCRKPIRQLPNVGDILILSLQRSRSDDSKQRIRITRTTQDPKTGQPWYYRFEVIP